MPIYKPEREVDFHDFFNDIEDEMKLFNTISAFKKNSISDIDNSELKEEYESQINSLQSQLAESIYAQITTTQITTLNGSKGGKTRNRNKMNKKKRTKRNIK